MSKNKIIFAVIGVLLVVGLLLSILFLKGGASGNTKQKKTSGEFTIWIVGDSVSKFEEFLSSYKSANKIDSNIEFVVQSFSDFETYNLALHSAIIKGKTPDIFILNNNETSLFEEKVLALPNNIVNVNDFRKNYKGIFNDDLIVTVAGEKEDDPDTEFLKGIPVGYETLGIFYNRRYRFKSSDFNSLAALNGVIQKVAQMGVVPIAIGNGSTIQDSGDILAQFFLLNKAKSITEADGTKVKQALGVFTQFGTVDGDNVYNSLYTDAIDAGEDNVDLFIDKKVASLVGYPRLIKKLEAAGFSKNLLYAAPFPHDYSGDGPSLANYNYFAIYNDTEYSATAFRFMQYLNSDVGANELLKKYNYYLPARLSLESELEEKRISKYFKNIVLADFYSEEPLSSFDKANKVIYDRDVIPVLDNFSGYSKEFSLFRKTLLCKSDKILNLTNLGTSCK